MWLITSLLTGDPGTIFFPVLALFLMGCGFWPFAILANLPACHRQHCFFCQHPRFWKGLLWTMDCEYHIELLDLRIWSSPRLCVSGSMCVHKSHAYFQKGFPGSGQILRYFQHTRARTCTHTHTHTQSPHPHHLLSFCPNSKQSLKLSSNPPLPADGLVPLQLRALPVSPCPSTRAGTVPDSLVQTGNVCPLLRPL